MDVALFKKQKSKRQDSRLLLGRVPRPYPLRIPSTASLVHSASPVSLPLSLYSSLSFSAPPFSLIPLSSQAGLSPAQRCPASAFVDWAPGEKREEAVELIWPSNPPPQRTRGKLQSSCPPLHHRERKRGDIEHDLILWRLVLIWAGVHLNSFKMAPSLSFLVSFPFICPYVKDPERLM